MQIKMSDVMRRYLSINWKGLCPKSCQLSSECSQLCVCFNLDHSAFSHGVKSHQEDAGRPLEVALTFSFFLWGFQVVQKEQVSFLEADSLLWVDEDGALTLIVAVPKPVLLRVYPAQPSLPATLRCGCRRTSSCLLKDFTLPPEQQKMLQKGNV